MLLWYIFSMIEIMEDYTNELEERVKKKKHIGVQLVPDDISLNMEPVNHRVVGELVTFTKRNTAVMMMCVDSATAESGSDCNLVDVIREAAMSDDVDEVVLVEEAWNSIIVADGPNVSQSTGTSVAQLLALAKQVINKVPNTD